MRCVSSDGELDGVAELRVDPPARAWLQVRTRALFALVGERVVVALPGDGYVLEYEERADALERLPFAESSAVGLTPEGTPAGLLQLLVGRVPWPAAIDVDEVLARARVGGSPASRLYEVDLPPEVGPGGMRILLAGGDLARFEWRIGEELRLEVRYDRYRDTGAGRLPTRLRVRAPSQGLRLELELDRLEPRQGFAAAEFEVGGNSPGARRVHGG